MHYKKIIGLLMVAGLAAALLVSAGQAGGSVVAQARAGTSTILAVHGAELTLSRAKAGTLRVTTGPGTIVLKNGTFAAASALKVGDRILLNPAPVQVGADGANANATPGGGQAKVPAPMGDPNGNGSSVHPPVTSAPPTVPQPDSKNPQSNPSGGAASSSAPLARLIWVPQGQEQLLRGTVRAVQGDRVLLYAGGRDVTLLVGKGTVYQRLAGAAQAAQATTLAAIPVNSGVLVLGAPAGAARTFRAQAILVDVPIFAPGGAPENRNTAQPSDSH